MPLGPDELEPLLRLALVQGVGPHRLARLVDRFGSAERALAAPAREVESVAGIGRELSSRVRAANSVEARKRARAALAGLKRLGAVALTPDDRLFPHPFKDLSEAPYLLFALGDPEVLTHPAIAVVGTRSPTAYGRAAARDLSRDLVLAGYAVVSGMARGIDTAAHLGALDAGGPGIGILGHGIEQVYPPENGKLFARIAARGVLITEYPPGETPKAGNFPRRNRLITALAEGVVVVEMGHRSGAQHTVTYALEQGKEVMAVPGPIGSPASEGTNQLIKDGARMVTSASDVVEELDGVGTMVDWRSSGSRAGRADSEGATAHTLPLLTDVERRLLEALSPVPAHVDELVTGASIAAPSALATLLELELRGLVRSLPGKRYVREF